MAYSDEVLEETPTRVTRFLTGMGAVPTLRTLLAGAGMTDRDIAEGRSLLLACLAAPASEGETAPDTETARAQRDAVAALDQWDEPNFARYQAALHRHHPDAESYVFQNLVASSGVTAVQGVATFLARVDALEAGSVPAREAQRKDDAKAVKLLASRGLTAAERKRLQGLVTVALGPTETLSAPSSKPFARRDALVALRDWYEEWAASARAVVGKRGYLIRLGLAKRKNPGARKPPAKPSDPPSK